MNEFSEKRNTVLAPEPLVSYLGTPYPPLDYVFIVFVRLDILFKTQLQIKYHMDIQDLFVRFRYVLKHVIKYSVLLIFTSTCTSKNTISASTLLCRSLQ